jgi:hypothetical protein
MPKKIVELVIGEAALRALEDRFTAAFNAGDVDAMRKNYLPGKADLTSRPW